MFEKLYRSAHPLSLEKSLLDQIEGYKKKNPLNRISVLVPNHYVGAHLQHELASKKAHINIAFETLEGFAAKQLSSNSEFLKKKRLTPELELFWIGKTAEQHLKNTELENISGKNGFHKNLRSFFHHLISHQSSKIPNINTKTKNMHEEIANIYCLPFTAGKKPNLIVCTIQYTPTNPNTTKNTDSVINTPKAKFALC